MKTPYKGVLKESKLKLLVHMEMVRTAHIQYNERAKANEHVSVWVREKKPLEQSGLENT